MSDAMPAAATEGGPAAATAAPPAEALSASRTWNLVNQPGCYVCNDTGRLFRVPASALGWAGTPNIQVLGPQGPSRVTRVSTNSTLPIEELRLLSAGVLIKPQF
jgi:hypothetical protein